MLAIGAPSAQAGFEFVAPFPSPADEAEGRLDEVAAGVAVNEASHDVYVADGAGARVLRYGAEGGLIEGWGWGVADKKHEFERCGPPPEAKTCIATDTDTHGEGAGEFVKDEGVAVDQSTGNVYVLDAERKSGVVQVFSPTGELITSFGQLGNETKLISENPELLYTPRFGIAVDASGNVYIVDEHEVGGVGETRVMVFRPKAEIPQKYEHYEYTGQSGDIAVGDGAQEVAVDSAGDVYVSAAEEHIYKFAAGDLGVRACESQKFSTIEALAVNDGTGEVYFFTGNDRFHRLNASCKQLEEFPGATIELAGKKKKEETTHGLAFGAGEALPGGHPAGVLYAIDADLRTGLIFAQPPVFPPAIDSESVSAVGSTHATLTARIDPNGNETHYSFQYGGEVCVVRGECIEAPVGGGTLNIKTTVGVTLSGLTANTKYFYRVKATNKEGTVEGKVNTFKTFVATAPGLPDGRAYELVSPISKAGGEVFPDDPGAGSCDECEPGLNNASMPRLSAPDGNSVVYEGDAFAAAGGSPNENEYLSVRTASGWETRGVSAALEKKNGNEDGFKAFSPDLSIGALIQLSPALTSEAPEGFANLYLEETADEPPVPKPVLTSPPPHRGLEVSGINKFRLAFGGANSGTASVPAYSHIVFEANDALTSETPVAPAAPEIAEGVATTESDLYEQAGGQLRLVNVLPGDIAAQAGAELGSGAELATTAGDPDFDHAISADGSKIYWSNKAGQVYVRVSGEATVEVPDSAKFLTASADGSKVLLDDGQVYELDEEGTFTKLVDLTGGEGGFVGSLGASEDLASVYFVATSVLASNENENKEKAESGADNLYWWHGETTVFVAKLLSDDSGSTMGDWTASPSDRTAQVTPDGRYLAFMSQAALTGYDSEGAGGECAGTKVSKCFEVFEYDASTGRLTCASCNPAGTPPLGRSELAVLKPRSGPLPQPRYLFADGRLFFDSRDSLSPYDTNKGVQDVYEYEPGGTGSCARLEGCIGLISSGQGTQDSSLATSGDEGRDVFFATRDQLLPRDRDDLIDLYDAREPHEPGEQVVYPEATSVACKGEECRPPSPQPPAFPEFTSAALPGFGNVVPTTPAPPPSVKCAKGKKLSHGKCIKIKKKAKVKQKPKSKAKKSDRGVKRGGWR